MALTHHCFAHRLNLACNDAIQSIKPLNLLKDKFGSFFNYFHYPSVRLEKFGQCLVNVTERSRISYQETIFN